MLYPLQVEAARSDWRAVEPPATGWIPVTLPDVWTAHWPHFDGVVWYRITWDAGDGSGQPRAAWVDYMVMAGAVYLNGALIDRDESLLEPLSRSWNRPRYWLLPAPLVHPGTNTLLVRVSGFADFRPGLGRLDVGTPAAVRPLYRSERLRRHVLLRFSLAVTLTVGCFFLMLWMLRRRASVYGWYSLQSLTWWCYAYNQVAHSPWPFTRSIDWEIANSVAFVLYSASFTMFAIRFCERRLPRVERALWLCAVVSAAALTGVPHAYFAGARMVVGLFPAATFMLTCIALIVFALRHRRADWLAMACCMAIYLVVGVHDMLVFVGVLPGNAYYGPLAAPVEMIGMAAVLAWRFVDSLRRIENFNDELTASIGSAREELRATLHRQHELEVANARLNERLNLAHDLHDGLGSTLVSNIAALEHAPDEMPAERFLAVLKELRDDLRIIIDAASAQQSGLRSLTELIAPLRHRLTHSFERHRIVCDWRLVNLDGVLLSGTRGIDVVRVLQEGLTNVLRHSGATRVNVELAYDGAQLTIRIADNGRGFDTGSAALEGTGMRSMRMRAQRLGGTFQVTSGLGGTVLSVVAPVPR